MKRLLFWVHLVLGLTAGLVIALQALSGIFLAFEPQLREWLDPVPRAVPVPGVPRLNPSRLLEAARQDPNQDREWTGFRLKSDPTEPAQVLDDHKTPLVLHPQTGEKLGERRPLQFFLWVLELHQELAAGELGASLVGLACAALLVMCLSGLILWWPRNLRALRAASRLHPRMPGKAFYWNLHNVLGIYTLVILTTLSSTGLIMVYPWAREALYRVADGVPLQHTPKVEPVPGAPRIPMDEAWERAQKLSPPWSKVYFFLPDEESDTYRFDIVEMDAPHDQALSKLDLDARDGSVLRWTSWSQASRGATLWAMVKPLHRGLLLGVGGQIVAVAGALAALGLVYSGFRLAWLRFRAWRKRTRRRHRL